MATNEGPLQDEIVRSLFNLNLLSIVNIFHTNYGTVTLKAINILINYLLKAIIKHSDIKFCFPFHFAKFM